MTRWKRYLMWARWNLSADNRQLRRCARQVGLTPAPNERPRDFKYRYLSVLRVDL